MLLLLLLLLLLARAERVGWTGQDWGDGGMEGHGAMGR